MKRFALAFVLLTALPLTASAGELLYFYSDACSYCEQWDNEVGGVYPLTEEAKDLRLRPVDIHEPSPDDIEHVKGIIYTPTFVAMENGQEIGRIIGYGGDIFFWEHLAAIMSTLREARAGKTPLCPDGKVNVAEAGKPPAC